MDTVLLRRKTHDLQQAFLGLHCRSQHILTAYDKGAGLEIIRAIGMAGIPDTSSVTVMDSGSPSAPSTSE